MRIGVEMSVTLIRRCVFDGCAGVADGFAMGIRALRGPGFGPRAAGRARPGRAGLR